MADAVTWDNDGHCYDAVLDGCTRCGIDWMAYLAGPVPCTAERTPPMGTPIPPGLFGPEPEPWRWGYCGSGGWEMGCGVELCPALDGDGSLLCRRCQRGLYKE